jgi:Dyp-type peroxidase family
MKPKFYDELGLKSDGQTIAAGGPCNWDEDDVSAEISNVTVYQGDVVASNTGPIQVQKDSNEDWRFDIDSSGRLTGGRALASAVATVRTTDSSTYEFSWPDEVELVQPDMTLDLKEIQGNIAAGFRKDFASFLFLALPDEPTQARVWLAEIVDQVATAEEVKQFNDLFSAVRARRGDREGVVEAAWMNLALTHEGLGKLGVDESELGQFPEEFREGMRKRKGIIGDVGDNDPDRWPSDLGGRTIHALMIVAADSMEDLNREALYFIRQASSHGVSLVFKQDGMSRTDAPGHEHFGFRDGISQPRIRGLAASSSSSLNGSGEDDSHHDLVAGGEFVVGYSRGRRSGQDPAGDPLNPQPGWTRNGSYLVFRRLRQDVKGFRDFVTAEAAKQNMSVDLFEAKLVGRYQSGAPLALADNAAEDPGTAKSDILKKDKINAFGYSTDPEGTQVPRAAHIRKAYSRDQQVTDNEPGERPRILRAGIPFGQSFSQGNPPDSPYGAHPDFPNDRGLCFVCYQRSIRDQFELIQRSWVNDEAVPEDGDGVDPVASQASQSSPERLFRLPGGAIDPVRLSRQWVTTTGGEYFFSPSISALEWLSDKQN